MQDRVKQFIEDNIALIENKEWTELFLKWYGTSSDVYHVDDKEDLEKLFEILNILDVTKTSTMKCRKDVLNIKLNNIVETILHNYNSIEYINYDRVLSKLHSTLGFYLS